MSWDTLFGRVLMVAPADGWLQGDTGWLDDLQPAGVILFRRHLPADAEEARAAIARLQAWSSQRGETLLIAMDEEGGFVTQTGDFFPVPPSARALARGGSPGSTRKVYQHYGARLHALGVNVDFAPVCDVNNNPLNPVIGVRSFAHGVDEVTAHALAAHEGLTAAGLLSCAKHFPGHGDTDVDSHLALPLVSHDRRRFNAIELRPFRALVSHVPLVMVGHLACPGIGDGDLPATLSNSITTRLLRDELGFQGVAVTDSMDMQGVTDEFGYAEAAPRALDAGCDLLLYCFGHDAVRQAQRGIRQALSDGTLSEERLNEAAERVDHLRALALARGDAPQAARPLPPFEEDLLLYRNLCQRSLKATGIEAWASLAHQLRNGQTLPLFGFDTSVVERLVRRLTSRGCAVQVVEDWFQATLLVLAERRPLEARLAKSIHEAHPEKERRFLANLLTPEVDVAFREQFAGTVHTADCSDGMLDVFVDWLLQEGAA
jgi:beta-glucosidase-like glycosyl hydrolase